MSSRLSFATEWGEQMDGSDALMRKKTDFTHLIALSIHRYVQLHGLVFIADEIDLRCTKQTVKWNNFPNRFNNNRQN